VKQGWEQTKEGIKNAKDRVLGDETAAEHVKEGWESAKEGAKKLKDKTLGKGSATEKVKDSLKDGWESVKEGAQTVKDKTVGTSPTDKVRSAARDAAYGGKENIKDAERNVRDAAYQAKGNVEGRIEESQDQGILSNLGDKVKKVFGADPHRK